MNENLIRQLKMQDYTNLRGFLENTIWSKLNKSICEQTTKQLRVQLSNQIQDRISALFATQIEIPIRNHIYKQLSEQKKN